MNLLCVLKPRTYDPVALTHWNLNKVVDILKTAFFKWNAKVLRQISPKFVQKGPMKNKAALHGLSTGLAPNLVPTTIAWINVNTFSLQWHHNERDGVSDHRCLDCLLGRLFRRRSKKTAKVRITGLCKGNPPVTGGFPSQRASNAANVSIWWRHHVTDAHTCHQASRTQFKILSSGRVWTDTPLSTNCWICFSKIPNTRFLIILTDQTTTL